MLKIPATITEGRQDWQGSKQTAKTPSTAGMTATAEMPATAD